MPSGQGPLGLLGAWQTAVKATTMYMYKHPQVAGVGDVDSGAIHSSVEAQ